jgi:hypothetical protein
MLNRATLIGAVIFALSPWIASSAEQDEAEFTQEFPIEDCHFKPYGGNPYFALKPGRQSYFSNLRCVDAEECDELEEVWITVTPQVRRIRVPIDGRMRSVWTRVVEEREAADGELVEVSRNYFADCAPAHDVYYFGEEVDDYEDGQIVGHGGAWLAGENGALPGIIMPDSAFIVGSRYYQEFAPGIALDRAEHVATNVEASVPAGVFEDCIEVTETTPLDSTEESSKVYCRGIGLVVDDDLELMATYGANRGYREHDDGDDDDD